MHDGINFSIFSKDATEVSLLLFRNDKEKTPFLRISLDASQHRTGEIWHIHVAGISADDLHYLFNMDRIPNEKPYIYRYDPKADLLDPYARILCGAATWGRSDLLSQKGKATLQRIRTRRGVVDTRPFDWGDDTPPSVPIDETIIYELHVRGYTVHSSSGVRHPGTFLGLTEKIPYLKDLGVTAVELLPVYEFEENDIDRVDPLTGEPLVNFWGYNPISFFSPKESYALPGEVDHHLREFREMVRRFHEAGIEVILDVVFNHTAEGDERGHTFNFRGIDNPVYYMLDPVTGKYLNYSGCGNTVNCNHPVVRDLILDALRYWVTEMHVDGFRFDLASILSRGSDGEVLPNPPLIEHISLDPILAEVKLIAEAWDAAGLYQVGTFPSWGRWAEWNGKFRDDVRSFVKGDAGMVHALAQRIMGSPDLYRASGRSPFHSINFVTSHDGFTLRDLVSYNVKHNERNGENNRDGTDDNRSWNCGVEGETDNPAILRLRKKQQKNFAFILLLSHGVPMILGGDEFGRTQRGNNNAYCQDNEISWVDWALLEEYGDLHRFFKKLIRYRKAHRIVHTNDFLEGGSEILFHGVLPHQPDWSPESRSLGVEIKGIEKEKIRQKKRDLYLYFNAYWGALDLHLPPLPEGYLWYRVIDTDRESPEDFPDDPEPLADQLHYRIAPRSCLLLEGREASVSEPIPHSKETDHV